MDVYITSSKTVEWNTPLSLFLLLDHEFHFTLDPCSTHKNALCKKHFTIKDNGLIQNWDHDIVYCNPPYGREISLWIKKGFESQTTSVFLIPARTDTKWFHDYIYHNPNAEIRFIKGRLKFSNSLNSAPFPSMIVIFRNGK